MARVSRKRTEELKKKRDRLDAARHYRKSEMLDDKWRRFIDLYKGRHFDKDSVMDDQDLFVVNVSKATVDVILPSVAVNYPKISVTPVSQDDFDSAVIAEAVVNYWWRRWDVLPEFQAALLDDLIVGFGWLKVGYRHLEEEVEDEDGYAQAVSAALDEREQAIMASPLDASSFPSEDEVIASVPVVTNTVVTESRPFVERVSPFDIFVDPEAKSMHDARWVAQRVYKSVDEVRSHPDYKPSARNSVEADSRWSSDSTDSRPTSGSLFAASTESEEAKRVTVWEMWDLVEGTVCTFSETGDDYLVDPVEQPYEYGPPFVMLRNYDVPDQFYPMGELEAIEPLQNELNLTRTQMFNDRKQFQRKWIARRDAFDDQAMNALQSSRDNTIVWIDNNEPLEQIISQMPVQPVNPELFQDSAIIENDLREVSGVSEYMRGSTPETRRTATEVNVIADAANARAQNKLARVEAAIGEIGEKMVQVAQQYLTGTQAAMIMQSDGEPFTFEFTPEDIQGEFHFIVQGGSTRPLNETAKRDQALELLNVLAPFADPAVGIVSLPALLDHVLTDGFGLKDTSKFLASGGGPTAGMGMPPEEIPPELAAMLGPQAGVPPDAAAAPAAGQLPPGGEATLMGGPPQGELTPEDMAMEEAMQAELEREQLEDEMVEDESVGPEEMAQLLAALQAQEELEGELGAPGGTPL